jgi:hypothetical protein
MNNIRYFNLSNYSANSTRKFAYTFAPGTIKKLQDPDYNIQDDLEKALQEGTANILRPGHEGYMRALRVRFERLQSLDEECKSTLLKIFQMLKDNDSWTVDANNKPALIQEAKTKIEQLGDMLQLGYQEATAVLNEIFEFADKIGIIQVIQTIQGMIQTMIELLQVTSNGKMIEFLDDAFKQTIKECNNNLKSLMSRVKSTLSEYE